MTERQTELAAALAQHRAVYVRWQRDQASDAELRATEVKARQLGATDAQIRETEASVRMRQEPIQ